MTTSSSPVRGRALLMSTAAASFVLSAALVAGPASAANECGTQSGATVTCPANTTFPNGITYTPTTDLTLVTNSTDTVSGPVSVSSSAANVTVQNAAAITTTAASAPGVYAASTAGNATVTTTGTISTSGTGSDGVDAVTHGAGDATVTVGTVDSTGAVTGTGSISATGTGSAGVAALAYGSGKASVTVNQNSTVSGPVGVVLGATPSTTGATSTLNNYGTVTGTLASVYSLANTGGVVVNNASTATLNGPIVLDGGVPGSVGNTVNNAGTWNVNGDSSFGGAGTTNVLNNTGTINVSPATGTTVTPNTVTLTNLSAINNAGGAIDLTKGESLDTGTAVFNGGTTSNGVNSTLRINANSTSGVLFVPSTGTGATQVVLADIPKTHPAMNFNGETLVTGNAFGNGPSAGSFGFGASAANADQNEGFVDYRLVYNGATATTPANYTLFGLPGQAVFEALNIPYALQDFWRHSANQLTLRQQSIRDSMVGQNPTRPEGWEFWAQPYGGEDYYKRPDVYRFGGFTFGSIGNHNDTVGLQVGADALANWMGGHGYWGFTGGVEQQTTHFQFDDSNDLYSVGGNIGMYGGMDWGGFYVNALGKIDWDNMNTNFFTAGFSPTNTYKAYGARAEAGYRWPWQGFYVEPSVRGNFIWNDSVDLAPAGAALRTFDDQPVGNVEAGGRVGTTFNFGRIIPGAVNPFPGEFNIFFGAWYADQWMGQNRMNFTTFGGVTPTSINLFQLPMGQYIHTEYGLETADWYGGLKLFLKGENDFNGDSVGGWNAQAGVRFSF